MEVAYREVGEHSKRAAQKANEIYKVVAGLAARLHGHPVVVRQLQELVYLLVQVSVNLLLSSMAGVLGNKTTLPGMESPHHQSTQVTGREIDPTFSPKGSTRQSTCRQLHGCYSLRLAQTGGTRATRSVVGKTKLVSASDATWGPEGQI